MGFYCFLAGSVGSGAHPAVRKRLVSYGVTAVDACIPLHIVTSYNSNPNKVCVRACTCHPRVGRKQTNY